MQGIGGKKYFSGRMHRQRKDHSDPGAVQSASDTKKVLYLTYNRLLKLDARAKIQKRNVTVTNYHGFAYAALKANGISAGISDLVQRFIQEKPAIGAYEYPDH